MDIDKIIEQFKELYHLPSEIKFDTQEYVAFHNDLDNFVYQNHLENTPEWVIISGLLLFRSTQHLTLQNADTIHTHLNILKRRLLKKENTEMWNYIHPKIITVSKKLYEDENYSNSAENAFKEVASRARKLFKKISNGKQEPSSDSTLMTMLFLDNDPILEICSRDSITGHDIQKGYMQLFAGSMAAFRNPSTHSNDEELSSSETMRQLVFASMLMYKIDEAVKYSNIEE